MSVVAEKRVKQPTVSPGDLAGVKQKQAGMWSHIKDGHATMRIDIDFERGDPVLVIAIVPAKLGPYAFSWWALCLVRDRIGYIADLMLERA